MVENLYSIGQSLIRSSGIKSLPQNSRMKDKHLPQQQASTTSSLNNLNKNQSANYRSGNQATGKFRNGSQTSQSTPNRYQSTGNLRSGNQSFAGATSSNITSNNQRNAVSQPCSQYNRTPARNNSQSRERNRSQTQSGLNQIKIADPIILDCSLDDEEDIIDLEKSSADINQTNNCSTSENHSCFVLNCEATFSSEGSLGQHMNLFKHSPCNPCVKAIDCKLSPDILCYLCPDCDKQFSSEENCRIHMRSERHSPFLPPLGIAAYMCAQCLCLFESFERCWNHMEEASHQSMCYPFSDDHSGGGIGPVAVPEYLVRDFVKKCSEVPFRVQCLECYMLIETPAILRHHRLETNNTHVVSSLTDTSMVDVFAGYLSRYTCEVCHRLFNSSLTELAEHQCASGILGKIVENDTSSFAEFVKRCAISLMKSVETESQPGTSREIPMATFVKSGPSGKKRNKSKDRGKAKVRNETATFVVSISDDENEEVSAEMKNKGKIIPDIVTIESDNDSPQVLVQKRKNRSSDSEESSIKIKLQKNEKQNEDKNAKTIIINFDETKSINTSRANRPVDTQVRMPKSAEKQGSSQPVGASCSISRPFIPNEFCTGQHSSQPITVPTTPISSNTSVHQYELRSHTPTHVPLRPQSLQQPIPRHASLAQNVPRGSTPVKTATCAKVLPLNISTTQQVHRQSIPAQIVPRAKVSPPSLTASKNVPRAKVSPPNMLTQQPGTSSREPRGNAVSSHEPRQRSRSPLDPNESPISTANLSRMQHIIFLDLDNWPGFFTKLPRILPDYTFVWGFFGGNTHWKEPGHCHVFKEMKKHKLFHLHERCGRTKDAADFAIVLTVGTMHERLPKHIAFTIVSGDKGFLEVERQMKNEKRRAIVIDPHTAQRHSNDMIYILVNSVTDT